MKKKKNPPKMVDKVREDAVYVEDAIYVEDAVYVDNSKPVTYEVPFKLSRSLRRRPKRDF